jgi:hypothetical protein
MKRLLFCIVAAALCTAAGGRADGTWKGTISDSMCGVKHSADKHGGKAADHRACVEKCIKGGADYVLLAPDKTYKISNQAFADLKSHAGHEVLVTGVMKDDAITVSKIEMPKAETEKEKEKK